MDEAKDRFPPGRSIFLIRDMLACEQDDLLVREEEAFMVGGTDVTSPTLTREPGFGQEEWLERSFGEDRHRDDSAADWEIANLLARLSIKDTGCVLDLCCGSGCHSRALARRGYEVVGVDLSPVPPHPRG